MSRTIHGLVPIQIKPRTSVSVFKKTRVLGMSLSKCSSRLLGLRCKNQGTSG